MTPDGKNMANINRSIFKLTLLITPPKYSRNPKFRFFLNCLISKNLRDILRCFPAAINVYATLKVPAITNERIAKSTSREKKLRNISRKTNQPILSTKLDPLKDPYSSKPRRNARR